MGAIGILHKSLYGSPKQPRYDPEKSRAEWGKGHGQLIIIIGDDKRASLAITPHRQSLAKFPIWTEPPGENPGLLEE